MVYNFTHCDDLFFDCPFVIDLGGLGGGGGVCLS